MPHRCQRCDSSFDNESAYRKHLSRKTQCEDLKNCGKSAIEILSCLNEDKSNSHNCQTCGKNFKSRQSKWNHKQKCKLPDPPAPMPKTVCHETLRDFGNEATELSIIGDAFVEDCLKRIETGGLSALVRRVYHNESLPQNHNVFIKNMNHSQLFVRESGGWVVKSFSEVISKILSRVHKIFVDYLNERFDGMREDIMEPDSWRAKKLDYFNALLDKNSRAYRAAYASVRAELCNHVLDSNMRPVLFRFR